MGKQKLTIKELAVINFPSDVIKSLALNIMNRHFKHTPNEEKTALIKQVLERPEDFKEHPALSLIAYKLAAPPLESQSKCYDLEDEPKEFCVFGSKNIDRNAIEQMELVMCLPVSVRGALMPDAHYGYGLPIGGVLATNNSVIPYGVGMDIGCRMALSIIDAPATHVLTKRYELKKALKEYTHFGNEGGLEFTQQHDILDHSAFQETELLRRLHKKAVRQLGTSGSGNHFVEFGQLEVCDDNRLGLPRGTYTAILSHSGSRSLGAGIAQHYTDVAMSRCKLPGPAKPLAWLDLDSEEGQEYWLSMNLAGDYAKACHDQIHDNLCRHLGYEVLKRIENHHNFAWKERMTDGADLIVHRKGATPAAIGVHGIIPGSMTAPGFVVSGLGNESALNSAAHGAGRKLSRSQAKQMITRSALHKYVESRNVTLIGGSAEEAPDAYKDIRLVMKSQSTLVRVEATFQPAIVRMAND